MGVGGGQPGQRLDRRVEQSQIGEDDEQAAELQLAGPGPGTRRRPTRSPCRARSCSRRECRRAARSGSRGRAHRPSGPAACGSACLRWPRGRTRARSAAPKDWSRRTDITWPSMFCWTSDCSVMTGIRRYTRNATGSAMNAASSAISGLMASMIANIATSIRTEVNAGIQMPMKNSSTHLLSVTTRRTRVAGLSAGVKAGR